MLRFEYKVSTDVIEKLKAHLKVGFMLFKGHSWSGELNHPAKGVMPELLHVILQITVKTLQLQVKKEKKNAKEGHKRAVEDQDPLLTWYIKSEPKGILYI